MTFLKGRIAVALAFTLLLGSLAACGDDDDEPSVAADVTTTTEEDLGESNGGVTPKVEGGSGKTLPYEDASERPSDAELEKRLEGYPDVETEQRAPTTRTRIRAGTHTPVTYNDSWNGTYRGMGSIFEYDNYAPGVKSSNACGPAAAATVLADWGLLSKDTNGAGMAQVYNRYPPDVNNGNWGSTPGRVQSALAGYGMGTYWGSGEASLKEHLKNELEAIVLLDLGNMGGQWWTAHYVVVFGYDDKYVYVTNWPSNANKMSWEKFRKGWSGGTITTGAGTNGKFLIGYL